MIAPIRPPDPETVYKHRRLRHAYRMIASTFLPDETQAGENPAPVSARRAWLFTGWVVVVTVVYFMIMLG